jgi:hypothetical protein
MANSWWQRRSLSIPDHTLLAIRHMLFSSDEQRTKRVAEYHSRRHDARRFPVDESEDGTSVDLVAEGDVEHHSESDGNTPKTRQPLDREKDGTPEVQ